MDRKYYVGIAVHTFRNLHIVSAHSAANHKVTEAHSKSSNNKECSAGSLVDEDPHDASKYDKHGVLNPEMP
jgi:hypothetical protein